MSNNIKFAINKEDDNPNPITKLAIMTDLGDLNDVVKSLDSQLKLVYGQQLKIVDMLLTIDGQTIRYVTEPTNDQMMKAVHSNGLALQYILPAQQTHDIQMEAVNNNPYAIEFAYNPEHDVIESAMSVEPTYDEYSEFVEHPIKLLKKVVARDTLQDQMFSFALYEKFLKDYDCNINYIKDDIRGLPGEDKLWLMSLRFHRYSSYLEKCPKDIQECIIDDVLEELPMFLNVFDKNLWTDERCLKYINANEINILHVIIMRPDVQPIEWFKRALNYTENGIAITNLLDCMNYESVRCDLDGFDKAAQILETNKALKIVQCYSSWFGKYDGMYEYIFEKFDMKDIAKDVCDDVVMRMLSKISFLKRIKYKHRYKKCVKALAKEKEA